MAKLYHGIGGRRSVRQAAAPLMAASLAVAACSTVSEPQAAACDPFTQRAHLEKAKAETIARDLLAEQGLTVTGMTVTADIRRGARRDFRAFPFSGDDDVLEGYTAWADVAQCPEGRVVVDFAPSCRVKQVYTVYGCQLAGLPGY